MLYKNRFQKNNQPGPQPTPTTIGTSDKTAASEITNNFYQSYDTCMKNPPAAAAGKVSEYCQNNSGFTTSNFAANLEKGGTAKAGADPIFCAQNVPESIIVNPSIQITGSKALALVNETFGPTQIEIQVELLKENGTWKVDNIVCPLP